MKDFLQDLISFNTWANGKVVESLKSCPEVPPKGIELLSHILQNTWYVLDLIEGNDDGRRWYDTADYTLEECVAEIPRIEAAYKEMLERDSLDRRVPFVDFAGSNVERTVAELIFHSYDHCTYHRGQIAMIVREHGGEPAKTWFNRWIAETNRGHTT